MKLKIEVHHCVITLKSEKEASKIRKAGNKIWVELPTVCFDRLDRMWKCFERARPKRIAQRCSAYARYAQPKTMCSTYSTQLVVLDVSEICFDHLDQIRVCFDLHFAFLVTAQDAFYQIEFITCTGDKLTPAKKTGN